MIEQTIGILVGVLIAFLLIHLGWNPFAIVDGRIRHRKTRDVPPEEGQTWHSPKGKAYRIQRLFDNGRLCIHSGPHSFGESHEEWHERVMKEHLYLLI